MDKEFNGPILSSNILLGIVSFLSLFFISGWPARMLISGNLPGESGIGVMIIMPFVMVAGFVSIPIFFYILRAILNFPKLTTIRILTTSLITTALGVLGFLIPVVLPGLMYQFRVQNFEIKPTLVSQSLDQATQTYRYTLKLDNKTATTYKNVKLDIATGFLYKDTSVPFVWTANHAPVRTMDLPPGISTFSDSIYLGDCTENSMMRDGEVLLNIELIYQPENEKTLKKYIRKELTLSPELEGVDFESYYKGICDWFSVD